MLDFHVDVFLFDAEIARISVSDEQMSGLAGQNLKVQSSNMVQGIVVVLHQIYDINESKGNSPVETA